MIAVLTYGGSVIGLHGRMRSVFRSKVAGPRIRAKDLEEAFS